MKAVRYEPMRSTEFPPDLLALVALHKSPGRYLEFLWQRPEVFEDEWFRYDRATMQFSRVILEDEEKQ